MKTKWKLTVTQAEGTAVLASQLKAALGYQGLVAVDGKDDHEVVFAFDTEQAASAAKAAAEQATPNALCIVEAYTVPGLR